MDAELTGRKGQGRVGSSPPAGLKSKRDFVRHDPATLRWRGFLFAACVCSAALDKRVAGEAEEGLFFLRVFMNFLVDLARAGG